LVPIQCSTYEHGTDPTRKLDLGFGSKVDRCLVFAIQRKRVALASLALDVRYLIDRRVGEVDDTRGLETKLRVLVLAKRITQQD
jgi:hypothetical protein